LECDISITSGEGDSIESDNSSYPYLEYECLPAAKVIVQRKNLWCRNFSGGNQEQELNIHSMSWSKMGLSKSQGD
jgi:hypothetical protein